MQTPETNPVQEERIAESRRDRRWFTTAKNVSLTTDRMDYKKPISDKELEARLRTLLGSPDTEPQMREFITLWFGLDDEPCLSADEVLEKLGLSEDNCNKLIADVHVALRGISLH